MLVDIPADLGESRFVSLSPCLSICYQVRRLKDYLGKKNLLESDLNDEDSDVQEKKKNRNTKAVCDLIKHQGCVNCVHCTYFNHTTFAASWSELGLGRQYLQLE